MVVTIRVFGVQDTVSYFNRIATNIEPKVVIPASQSYAEALRKSMIDKMHYRSGRMRSMTKISKIAKGWSVIVDVPYAETENRRSGKKRGTKGGGQGTPHTFAEPAMKEVEQPQFTNFLQRLVTFLITP